MRKEFSGAAAFDSYEEALAADGDVAIVTTPTFNHKALTLQSLAANRHVVVEKPAFMHSGDAREVAEVAARVGRQVMVAENYFYKPVLEILRELIASGRLGEIRFVTMNAVKRQRASGWRTDPSLSGGDALFEGGVHWVSFANNLGMDVTSVRGFATGGANSSLLVFTYANGAVGTLAYSWEIAAPFGGMRVSRVHGTEGSVTFESNGLAMYVSGRQRSVRLPGLRDVLGYGAMWADFLSAIRSGGAPRFTLAMAQRDLELLEEAKATM
jgi:predicted dehydrogenase